MNLILDALAVDKGKEVQIYAQDRNGSDVSFTLSKKDYTTAKTILTNGIRVDELHNVITPHDIVGYLYESNPEAQNVMIDVEVQRGIRNKTKDTSRMVAYGGAFATIIMAMCIFYLVVVKDPAGAADVASNAASGLTVT